MYNELLVSEMQKKKKKKMGHRLRFRHKAWGKLAENIAQVIQQGLQGFIVKNIEGKSTEASDPSHIL